MRRLTLPPLSDRIPLPFGGMSLGGGAGGLDVVCPVITPTLGSDILAGYDFTSGWTIVGSVTIVDADSFTLAGTGGLTKNIGLTINGWYKFAMAGTYAGTLGARNALGNNINTIRDGFGTASFMALDASLYLRGTTVATANVNPMTAQANTFATMLATIGTFGKDGTFTCHPTVAASSQCGMLINYADANNFVMAIVDRTAVQAQLWKVLSGTWTKVVSGAITYSAAAELKVIASGGSYGLYYNGVQVGSNVAIVETTLGTTVQGFNALAGNTVGQVTANF